MRRADRYAEHYRSLRVTRHARPRQTDWYRFAETVVGAILLALVVFGVIFLAITAFGQP